MISRTFIERPVLSSVVSIVIVLLGVVSYTALPVAQYPELAPPVVRVEALYPGANARTIADTVASPIEQEVNGVDGMIYMSSTSSDGRYSLDISFELGTDIDIATVLVQNRVSIAEPRLPEEARRLGITTRKQSTTLAGVISLSSPAGTYDDLFLSNYITINWREEFARVPGVGAIQIFPAKDYGMRVWMDPALLKARGLSVSDVADAIRGQNVQVAAGKIGAEPAPTGTAFELIVNAPGRLSTPEEFGAIIVKSEDARVVRVRDIARVELGARDYSTEATFNGLASAVLVVYQLPGANLVELTEALEVKLAELTEDLPADVSSEFFYDSSMFVRASMEEVTQTLIEAFILVFIVVLIFLQSLRATIIPALTIPVSLIGTFVFMQLFGFSLNMLTMFGLVLAIGIVVDDAILVVENVERNMEEKGLAPKEATLEAMKEITGPIIATTLVLMAVFVPTATLPGISGQMFRQFALTIAVSTLLSSIAALSLSPALCAILLRPPKGPDGKARKGFILFLPFRLLAKLFNVVFDAITVAYAALVRFAGRLAPITLVIFAGVLVLSAFVFTRTPTGFVPDEDQGFVAVGIQLPDSSSLQRTREVTDQAQAIIAEIEGVQNVVALAGFSMLDGQGVTYANAWVVLDPWEERTPTGRDIDTIMQDIRVELNPIQEARFIVFGLPAIPGLGSASGFDMRLQDRGNAGRQALQQGVGAIVEGSAPQPAIAYAFSSFREAVPQLALEIDREKAIKLDIPLSAVFESLQAYLGSLYVNDFNAFNRTWQVSIQAEPEARVSAQDIRSIEVRSNAGDMIPLGTFVSVVDAFGPERVTRYNLYESATINGMPAPGFSSGETLGVAAELADDVLPRGIDFEWTGMIYQEAQIGNQAIIVFGLAIVLVFLVLAAQYESWTTPLAVVFSIPLVVLGAMVALNIRGLDFNVFTQIGLVLLVGLGAKNAILIVEFARERRATGASIVDSAVYAAKTRFRPILMTSFAFILGVVPLLTATGAGAAGRKALGTAVFGGMSGATILGLIFTPTLYIVVTWLTETITGRKPAAAGANHAGDAPKAATA
ncbi:MAG: multidrug efflux RND transporter permease subunit [Planctomycetota bacterium]